MNANDPHSRTGKDADVYHHQFRVDGYDLEQVDVFLDQIAEDLEARDAEKKQLEDQIADLTQQLEEARSHQEPESATESSDDAEQSAGPPL